MRKVAAVEELATVRRATAEEVRSATGFAIGGTAPFGHPSRLRTIADRDLLSHPTVWAAAGTPDRVFGIAPQELVRATGARVADIAEA